MDYKYRMHGHIEVKVVYMHLVGSCKGLCKATISFTPAKYDITTVISDNEQPKLQVTQYFFSNFPF